MVRPHRLRQSYSSCPPNKKKRRPAPPVGTRRKNDGVDRTSPPPRRTAQARCREWHRHADATKHATCPHGEPNVIFVANHGGDVKLVCLGCGCLGRVQQRRPVLTWRHLRGAPRVSIGSIDTVGAYNRLMLPWWLERGSEGTFPHFPLTVRQTLAVPPPPIPRTRELPRVTTCVLCCTRPPCSLPSRLSRPLPVGRDNLEIWQKLLD